MTLARDEEMPCPQCSATVKTKIWRSINVTLNPGLKQDLFKGEINRFRCPNCGLEASVAAPLLYHDMDINCLVQFYPAELLEKESFYDGFTADGKMDIGDEVRLGGGPQPESRRTFSERVHLVFGMDELLQYVTFRDRLSELKGAGDVGSRSSGLN